MLLAQQGINVAVISNTAEEIQDTAAEIKKGGHEAFSVTADIGQEEQVQHTVQQITKKFGRLDIVYANAGINGVWAPIDELSLQDWYNTINTNLTGTFLTIKHTVPYLKKQGGAIIVTASGSTTGRIPCFRCCQSYHRHRSLD